MQPERTLANPRRTSQPELVPLPVPIQIALRSVTSDLRNIPRDCIYDRAELIHWLNRMARRVEGIERTKVPAERPGWNAPKPAPCHPSLVTARDAADAVFGTTSRPTARKPPVRTVTSRKGRAVKVETRNSSRQLTLFAAQL